MWHHADETERNTWQNPEEISSIVYQGGAHEL